MEDYYFYLEVTMGNYKVRHKIHPEMMYDAMPGGLMGMTAMMSQQMVHFMARDQVAVDASKPWVFIVGKGLSGVRGGGYEAFTMDDFRKYVKDGPRICRAAMVPTDSIPKPCAGPQCREWATRTYGVEFTRSFYDVTGHNIWGKIYMPGDKIHCCGKHAHELIKRVRTLDALSFPYHGLVPE